MKKYFLVLPALSLFFVFATATSAQVATTSTLIGASRSECQNAVYTKHKDTTLLVCKDACKQHFIYDCVFDTTKVRAYDVYACLENKLPALAEDLRACETPKPKMNVPPPPSLSSDSSFINSRDSNSGLDSVNVPPDSATVPLDSDNTSLQTTAGTQNGSSDFAIQDQSAAGVSPEAAEFARWMKECYAGPLPNSMDEVEQYQRDVQNPSHPCYVKKSIPCVEAADGGCVPGSGAMTLSDGGRTAKGTASVSGPSPKELAACKQTCQTNQNSCAAQCQPIKKTSKDTYEYATAASACKDTCRAAYDKVWNSIYHDCFQADYKCRYEIINRKGPGGSQPCWGLIQSPCFVEIHDTCTPPYDACLKPAQEAGDACYAKCVPKEEITEIPDKDCLSNCEYDSFQCQQACENAVGTNQTSDNTAPTVGISAKDFKELAKANNEYQKAQSILDEIINSEDKRWEEKKDFAGISREEISKYLDNLSQDEQKQRQKDLKILRTKFEDIHEIASKYKSWSKIHESIESIKKGEVSDYGKLKFFTDAVNSFSDYTDLRDAGVSTYDAATKTGLDNFGTSALTIIPPFGVIELVATTPDMILKTFGVQKDNWSRKYITAGVIGKFAPSGVVKQTTDLMVQEDWDDIGRTISYAWQKLKDAEGVTDTLIQTGMLIDVVIGAGVVSVAESISNVVGGGMFFLEKAADGVGYIANLFTFPN